MLNFSQVDWPNVLPVFKINEQYLKKEHGPCPICSTATRGRRRFRFDNKNGLGTWFCSSCGAGNGFTLIKKFTGLSDAEILKQLEESSGKDIKIDDSNVPPVPLVQDEIPEAQVRENRVKLNAARNEAGPLTGHDPVSKYLQSRVPKCDLTVLSKHIMYHPGMAFYEQDANDEYVNRGVFPVMLALVVDSKGMPITLHRTYLTKDGKKAPFEMVKKQMRGVRKLKGAAIRLNDVPDCRVLGLTEGTETGYAVVTGYKNLITVWSLLNCINLSVADIPRDRFDKVIIFADHDEIDVSKGYRPGQHWAEKAKIKLEAEGFQVEIRMPKAEGTDFADVWFEICNGKK